MAYVYLIVLHTPDESAWSAVKDLWPDRHIIVNDHMAFVGDHNPPNRGYVICMNGVTYRGWDDDSVCEWLKKAWDMP